MTTATQVRPAMTRTQHDPYRSSAVETATPAQLVLMLFDGVLMSIERVRVAAERGADGIAIVNRELQRAQDIVTELQVTLDFDNGEPVAGNLAALYEYCQHVLTRANISKDVAELGAVSEVFRGLRDGWQAGCCTLPSVAATP